ncbi:MULTISPECIES: LytR/AlgR family response regulator transcription factor [Clostridium]|uniref:LytR/AlgR family response regulator transcription factor n=1 Tax=Clostridium TaxID=1485 RepID=UPI000825F627|nr:MULTISPECIES: LytTR family DNA-binding domain-containing protein [Clostridium]PJI06696.1 DNA-binding response regulator [Clostridium sp. CT7]
MNSIKCILIEDELPAMDELKFILEKYNEIEIVGTAENSNDGIDIIKCLKPEAVFLDINIPTCNGINLAKKIKDVNSKIAVIFVTAYDKYAVDAFEIMALDYILKPFDDKRIDKTVQRLKKYIDISRENNISVESRISELIKELKNAKVVNIINKIPCENNGKIILVDAEDIYFCYIESEKTYIKLYDKIYVTSNNLSEIEEKTGFFRAHRSYVVNINKILEIYSWFNGTYKLVMKDPEKSEIPVSRGNVKKLKEIINI